MKLATASKRVEGKLDKPRDDLMTTTPERSDAVSNPDTSPQAEIIRSHRAIAILTEGHSTPFHAKTAMSLIRYREKDISAIIDSSTDSMTAQELFGIGGEIPVVDSVEKIPNADALYVGIASRGGRIPSNWRPIFLAAIKQRMDVVSGLHDFVSEDLEFATETLKNGVRLIDVRKNAFKETASGFDFNKNCVRILTVGQDCSVGKMVTSLEIQRGLLAGGANSKFLATGQTGIMIDGDGTPVDCVVADFINGSAEDLVKRNQHHDFVLIEGQGSLSHPSFSAVTVGLLHGCAPNGLIFCYEAGRQHIKGLDVVLPDKLEQLNAYLSIANLRQECELIGVAVNTRYQSPEEAAKEIANAKEIFGVPACDVYREGANPLVEASIQLRNRLTCS